MTIGTTYKVSTGTLTIKSVDSNKLYTLWYEADQPEYSCKVQMGIEHLKKIVKYRIRK
jgi:hypothetical protein